MDQLYYLELCSDPIRFDSVSSLTTVFFDDSNKQLFAVRSHGATGITVKGPGENDTLTFCMEDKGPIRSIKFSPDKKLLAVQRTETCVEFITFANNQPNMNDVILHKGKNSIIYGFVWIQNREVVFISNTGVEIYTINVDKKQLKSIKSMNLSINWFSWCPIGNLAVLASNNGMLLTPVLIKQGIITRLPKLEWKSERGIPERDLTLAEIYGTLAILILKPTSHRLVEVVIYLLNGPGFAPKKLHVLRLGHSGRFAMNIVDDLIVVHHQTSGTSLLFDIALTGEVDANEVTHHSPITTGRPIKPFRLKMPSLSLDGQTKDCELYSPNWVLFQPNIVIDAKLGCLWNVNLKLDSLCHLITDRVRLVEFLLHRSNAKMVLVDVLKELLTTQYNNTMLTVIENVFDKLNVVYANWVSAELLNQTAQPPAAKQTTKPSNTPPRVLIDQNDLFINIFSNIGDASYVGKILMLYITSLAKYNIAPQHDISKMVIVDLVRRNQFDTLQNLIKYSLINESKPLACFLLSLSNAHPSITQMAIDMLYKLNAETIIIEVFLGQGKIIEALRLANSLSGAEALSARKYLEAAKKTNDPIVFYSVYTWFQQRNIRSRGSPDFLKSITRLLKRIVRGLRESLSELILQLNDIGMCDKNDNLADVMDDFLRCRHHCVIIKYTRSCSTYHMSAALIFQI